MLIYINDLTQALYKYETKLYADNSISTKHLWKTNISLIQVTYSFTISCQYIFLRKDRAITSLLSQTRENKKNWHNSTEYLSSILDRNLIEIDMVAQHWPNKPSL